MGTIRPTRPPRLHKDAFVAQCAPARAFEGRVWAIRFQLHRATYRISPVRTRYSGGEGHCVPPDVFLNCIFEAEGGEGHVKYLKFACQMFELAAPMRSAFVYWCFLDGFSLAF